MSNEQNSVHSFDQDKYQLALDAVIEQMNFLSNDPLNDNLRLSYEKARQRFIQISHMEKNEYEKFLRLKRRPSIITDHRMNVSNEDRIQHFQQSWSHFLPKLYLCSFILVFFFLTLAIVCILISLK